MVELYSTPRKKALSGWLKYNHPTEFASRLKLQKFLFFYETLSKIDGDYYDYNKLKGYVNGPVFADVYADYAHRTNDFIEMVEVAYEFSQNTIDDNRAKQANFLVKILTDEELSDLTHEFNMWNVKEDEIGNGGRQIPLEETDFNEDDEKLMTELKSMYPLEYIESVEVMWIIDKCFIFTKEDYKALTSEHKSILLSLSLEEKLTNPVYVELDEDGVMLID